MENSEQIAIIDYGLGNVRSIVNMFKKVGVSAFSTHNPDELKAASKLVLPGVGSFDAGMKNLDSIGFRPVMDRLVLEDGVPILGICLGMQLLSELSEEGRLRGLGWIEGRAVRFRFEANNEQLRIPHMGWNQIQAARPNAFSPDPQEENWFYFAHSYHVQCRHRENCLAETDYGCRFSSIIGRDNIAGVQFHPEKSHRYGMALLRRFAAWNSMRRVRAA